MDTVDARQRGIANRPSRASGADATYAEEAEPPALAGEPCEVLEASTAFQLVFDLGLRNPALPASFSGLFGLRWPFDWRRPSVTTTSLQSAASTTAPLQRAIRTGPGDTTMEALPSPATPPSPRRIAALGTLQWSLDIF